MFCMAHRSSSTVGVRGQLFRVLQCEVVVFEEVVDKESFEGCGVSKADFLVVV